MSYLSTDEAYDYNTLACWYQHSIDETQPPIWTDEHFEELLKDFYIIPKDTPTADVVPREKYNRAMYGLKAVLEERAEDKAELAREIFEEIDKLHIHVSSAYDANRYAELKKKYTEEKK